MIKTVLQILHKIRKQNNILVFCYRFAESVRIILLNPLCITIGWLIYTLRGHVQISAKFAPKKSVLYADFE